LSVLDVKEHVTIYRRRIVKFYLNLFVHMKSHALIGCHKKTKVSSEGLEESDLFGFQNFMLVVAQVLEYV